MSTQHTTSPMHGSPGALRIRRTRNPVARRESLPRAVGLGLLPVLVIVLLVVFGVPLLRPFPLTDPDEGLHAQIAREMVESRDWVTPRFQGKPFYDKPILFFWATAASLAVFGKSEAAARLPALVFGIWGVAATWALSRAMFRSTMTACAAALVLGTSIHYVVQSQVVVHDIALTACVTSAMLCLWKWDLRPASGNRRWLIAAAAMMGLACLAKGLLGLVLPTLVFGLYLVVQRRLTVSKAAWLLAAVVFAVLLAVPWYALMERANPGYLRYFVWQRHVLGFLGNEQRHGHAPLWYYIPVLLVGGWPWIGYLPNTLRAMWHRRPRAASRAPGVRSPAPVLFLLLWAGTVFTFFSLAGSKLHTYILPVYPAIAVLVAQAWQHHMVGAGDARGAMLWARAHTMVCWISAAAAPIAAVVFAALLEQRLPLLTACAVGSASALALCSWRLDRIGKSKAAFHTLAVAMAGTFAVVVALFMPVIAASKSHKELADVLRHLKPQTSTVLWWHDCVGSAAFYGVEGRLEHVESLDELARRVERRPARLVVRRHSVDAIESVAHLRGAAHYEAGDYYVYDLR